MSMHYLRGSRFWVVTAGVIGVALFTTGFAKADSVAISGSMEGALKVPYGSTMHAGYDFSVPGNNESDTVSVSDAKVRITGPCVGGADDGQTETITMDMPDVKTSFADASWYPSGSESDPSVWQGSAVSHACPGGELDASKGATFKAWFDATKTAPLAVRFHYKLNGAGSWSGTASVAPSPPPASSGGVKGGKHVKPVHHHAKPPKPVVAPATFTG